ncbi:MAG TPA: Spy/CpxP family protein refolding chaperone [Phenylobacterium sp.]|nr:Spy/CpxP family protein refolding chaperone [Phenylobacterium sp.]
MSRRLTVTIAGAACALYAAAGAAAFAQPTPAAPHAPGEHGKHHMGMRHERGEHRDPTAHLRAILQLKPGQEAALTAFVAAMKPPEHGRQGMRRMADGKPPAPKTTPERLAMMDKMMSEHMAKAHARLEAIRTFYNQLDPAQKRAFDELPLPTMGGHRGGPMRRMEMMRTMHRMPPKPPVAAPPHL